MTWLQLIVETDATGAPALAERLEQAGAASVTFQDDADQPLYEPAPGETPLWQRTRVVGLFPAQTDTDALIDHLRAALAPRPLPPYRLEALEDKDWVRAWMDEFKPMRFGERLWIVPSWSEPPDPSAVNLLLDPGLAFGTGTHPTTRLCLEYLDAHPPVGRDVVDYGCGSGVLAVAAARLGAARVWAVDNDPQALTATQENAERNGVGDRLSVHLPERFAPVATDLVLANILANPLIALAPRIAGLLRPGGALVLSGLLAEQGEAVRAAYAPWIDFRPTAHNEQWIRLDGVKK